MCFTIELYLTRKAIEKRFSVNTSTLYDFDFRYFYNAFSNPLLPVITQEEPDRIRLMEWGLIPAWAGDSQKAKQIRTGTYNARAESLHEKPSFREPFRSSRCWVIAHGFFEWQHVGRMRVPWYIRLRNNEPFVFAGLYDSWRDPETGDVLETFSIVTTAANQVMEKIHNTKKRMPVILNPENENDWISSNNSLRKLRTLMLPFPSDDLHAYTISNTIRSPEADPYNAEIIKPFGQVLPGSLF